MPFIGTQPEVGGYSVLDNLTASATASYTLQKNSANFVPSSANQLLVSLNGVIQKPGSSFTVSGSTLTFSSALTSSDSIDFILAMGEPLLVGTPSDGAVNTTQLATNAVSTAKIASSAVTDAKIAAGTISASKMASGFVNANTDFAAGVITAHAIAAGNVGSSELRTSNLLTANTQFNAGIVTAHAIATGAVGPTELAAGAVSANTKLAADVVGAREIRIGNLAAANAVFTHNSATYAKAQLGRVESVTVGAANVTINFANCNIFNLTLGTNSNLNRPSNIAVGQAGTIFVTQDGTGSRTLSYSSVWDFIGGTAPTLTTTASAVDRIDYVVYSTSRIQAVATLAYS